LWRADIVRDVSRSKVSKIGYEIFCESSTIEKAQARSEFEYAIQYRDQLNSSIPQYKSRENVNQAILNLIFKLDSICDKAMVDKMIANGVDNIL
jgi:hypothetical protein